MINIYDRANELASALKDEQTYKDYIKIRDEIYKDEAVKKMVEDFKKLQFEAQATYLAGQEPSADLLDKIQKTGEVLQFNPKITEFFTAEYRFNTLISDLYKIIFSDVAAFNMEG